MKRTRIYGASDDLVEIDGKISEEIGCYDTAEDGLLFNCSDGTSGIITYDGDWEITVYQEGTGFVRLINGNDEIPHTDEDAIDCPSYSDVLILEIDWITIKGKTYGNK